MNIEKISKQISDFFNVSNDYVRDRLQKGFHYNHNEVAQDFFKAKTDVNNSESLLNWYKTTDSYIWELSSYHLDSGFNYMGMCEGIAVGLKSQNKNNVLALGDGIGSLTIRLSEHGLKTTYHDLENSKTANFAQYRFKLEDNLSINTLFTSNFEPNLGHNKFDAVVALDFFEHLINVDEWVKAVYDCLTRGGVFIAQNAFAIGDSEHGNSIPMHLSINNKYETEWSSLLRKTGFTMHGDSQWWFKS